MDAVVLQSFQSQLQKELSTELYALRCVNTANGLIDEVPPGNVPLLCYIESHLGKPAPEQSSTLWLL